MEIIGRVTWSVISYTCYEFKKKLLYNEEKTFCTKTKLLDFEILNYWLN